VEEYLSTVDQEKLQGNVQQMMQHQTMYLYCFFFEHYLDVLMVEVDMTDCQPKPPW